MRTFFGKHASASALFAAAFFITALFGFVPHAAQASNPAAFITTWKTNNPGVSASNQITIPTIGGPTYNYNVDWGDSSTSTGVTGNTTHTYATPGTYTVTITGTFPAIYFANGVGTDSQKILSIQQWGTQHWAGFYIAFGGCANLVDNATDVPDLSGVTNTDYMFLNDPLFNTNIDNWDMSHVTTMYGMFQSDLTFNQPLNDWNLSSATDTRYLFNNAQVFNQPLNNWNLSNDTTMVGMFQSAYAFNQDISSWNVSSVATMADMFLGTGLSAANYSALLSTWSSQLLQPSVTFNAGSSQYCSGVAIHRSSIISTHGWTIIDGGVAAANASCSTPSATAVAPHTNAFIVTPVVPTGIGSANLDFTINGGATSTPSPSLALGFNADPLTVKGYAVSLDPTFANGGIVPYAGTSTPGTFQLPNTSGTYTVYVEYFSTTGNRSAAISHVISYDPSGVSAAPAASPSSSANPENPFAVSIAFGAQGSEVAALQKVLVADGELTLPAGATYGYFGSTTKAALEAFQAKYSIVAAGAPGSGIFGPKTRAKASALLNGEQN